MLKEIREDIERRGTVWSAAEAEGVRNLYVKIYKEDRYREGVQEKLENIRYGPHERNVLDVYVPKESSASKRNVVVFSHGGGLVAGDKSLYENIGNYFAAHGYIAVVNNYRLVPGVTYPGGGDDIQMVREWIYNNISKSEYGSGDPEKVVLIGHSAGGFHIATNIYAAGDPSRSGQDALVPPVAGIVHLSPPFTFGKGPNERRPVVKAYYGTDDVDEVRKHTPVGLIEGLPKDSPVLNPVELPTLILVAQYDPEEIQHTIFEFVEKYRYKSPRGILPELTVVPGHNHLSYVLAIGKEEDVPGRMLREFVDKVCSK
ncbi:hypothetical protein GYMLUDRAFT_72778 [Collybiopsis luxurians FD-317 M1]|uniref:BD-FAE-like domain-containing protein n=1 Tax=Collybiopsis luxurians FD-317 M1 TaxID=944289 RepID=A0A0D0CT61_9AGAR|nr:hypothetical protein GYMLUDRAFT_72778 [Collybiopsis luxurians FD-317 M1]